MKQTKNPKGGRERLYNQQKHNIIQLEYHLEFVAYENEQLNGMVHLSRYSRALQQLNRSNYAVYVHMHAPNVRDILLLDVRCYYFLVF